MESDLIGMDLWRKGKVESGLIGMDLWRKGKVESGLIGLERWDPDLDPQFVGIGSRLGNIPFSEKLLKLVFKKQFNFWKKIDSSCI